MTYVIERESRRAASTSGGKDYHLVRVMDLRGRNLLIMRWAKAGQWGTGIKVERFEKLGDGKNAWERQANIKFQRGCYNESIAPFSNKTYETVEELQKALGQYWGKLGNHLEWLIPGIGMGDAPAEEPAEWDDKSRRFVKPKRSHVADSLGNPVSVEPTPTVEDRVKENPQWGSW